MSLPQGVSRRTVLKTMALAAPASYLAVESPKFEAQLAEGEVYPENGTLVPDEGWHLWVDTKAEWESDELFLPDEVGWVDGKLCGRGQPLPAHVPTGGWGVLLPGAGKAVVLPTSVEQHFWGMYGAGPDGKPRPYTPEEYRYAKAPTGAPADDDVPKNGAYFGVSWFYRALDIPASMRDQRIILHVRGAHLRAEVYLNGQLCGYSVMEELPFEADLTRAARPGGENLLGIRITNPFGRFDWVDGLNAKWGQVSLYRSHGFGALDRGMTLSAHGAARIARAWALNTPEPRTVEVHFEVESPRTASMPQLEVVDAATGAALKHVVDGLPVEVRAGAAGGEASRVSEGATVRHFRLRVHCPDAVLWDLNRPKLYHLRLRLEGDAAESYTVPVGFRWFATEGFGSKALFRLNGRRVRIYSAISWGFWGLNGMFPVPELAKKEVRAAQALGLNCLNFHRNLAKEDVLRKHDELGVLRYMEPGAGKLAIGRMPAKAAPNSAGTVPEDPKTEAERFAQRYMFVKCVEMVQAHRSHPSVMEYCLQNELGADLNNPATLAVLRAMHEQDPSRVVLLNDGFVAREAAQAWFEPWSGDGAHGELKQGVLHRSDQEKWGDWWNNHQGAGDQWYDQFYRSPTDYTYRAPYADVLTEYGEMEGCARPDNHTLMVHQIKSTYARYGGDSYDLQDHEEIIAGYERFLDRWGFRKAFPSSESVFKAVGRTCYESWMNYMENARISDELDFAAISGWESTSIENHSGIVDNLRNFKSDPELIRGSLLPIRPLAKQRTLVVERGKPAIFDLYLANDTPEAARGELTFSMVTPSGKRQELVRLAVPAQQADVFSYLLRESFATPPLSEEGLYRFKFSLSSVPSATQTKELWVTKGEALPTGKRRRVAISGVKAELRQQLLAIVPDAEEYKAGERYDLIVSAGMTVRSQADGQVGETTGEQMPVIKPGHAPEPGEVAQPTQLGSFAAGILDAVRSGAALLAIPHADTLSEGLARELAAAGAFAYRGTVGDFRAPWMGNWYFVREHALFAGMPVNCAMGGFYQAPGRQSNGLLVDRGAGGADVEIVVAYSRDHDRNVGAGTFTTRLGKGNVVFHRVPPMHPVMQSRFLANAMRWLTD